MTTADIKRILEESGFEVRKSEPRNLIVYEGYDVGRVETDAERVELHYHFRGANYGSETMATGVARLRKLVEEKGIPYTEKPSREELLREERRLIEGLEKSIADSKERIRLVGGETA
jgi:hypothetical protein